MKKVAVVMGSDSDLPVLEGCFQTLKKLNIPYEAHVYSAHRTRTRREPSQPRPVKRASE